MSWSAIFVVLGKRREKERELERERERELICDFMSHENDLCDSSLCVCRISDGESNGGLYIYIYVKVKKEKGPNSKAKAQLRKHLVLSHLSRKQTRVILFLRLCFFYHFSIFTLYFFCLLWFLFIYVHFFFGLFRTLGLFYSSSSFFGRWLHIPCSLWQAFDV